MVWTLSGPAPRGPGRRPLLLKEMEEAQANTKSGFQAARYLGVSYGTYRKYAKLYGIHDRHINMSGKGIPKTHVQDKTYPLQDILDGKHPHYDLKKLKKRLIKGGYFDDKCQLCGFNEKRITDNKAPLMLVFKDGDSSNHRLDNMGLLCYNCAYLTVGELDRINPNRFKKSKMFTIDQEAVLGENEISLSPDEMAKVIEEAKSELPQ